MNQSYTTYSTSVYMDSLLQNQYAEDRPWGAFERFTLNELSTVKIRKINAGKRTSLQLHHNRTEFWGILKGVGTVSIGGKEENAKEGMEFLIPPETTHRVTAGDEGIEWLEIALGTFDEGDEVRLEDDYGR